MDSSGFHTHDQVLPQRGLAFGHQSSAPPAQPREPQLGCHHRGHGTHCGAPKSARFAGVTAWGKPLAIGVRGWTRLANFGNPRHEKYCPNGGMALRRQLAVGAVIALFRPASLIAKTAWLSPKHLGVRESMPFADGNGLVSLRSARQQRHVSPLADRRRHSQRGDSASSRRRPRSRLSYSRPCGAVCRCHGVENGRRLLPSAGRGPPCG
jgi:hypothetical protein